jgi:hypothetical protein
MRRATNRVDPSGRPRKSLPSALSSGFVSGIAVLNRVRLFGCDEGLHHHANTVSFN